MDWSSVSVVSQRRQSAWLKEIGARERVKALPWALRLSGLAPLALALLADAAGGEQPVPAVILVGGFVVVWLLIKRRVTGD